MRPGQRVMLKVEHEHTAKNGGLVRDVGVVTYAYRHGQTVEVTWLFANGQKLFSRAGRPRRYAYSPERLEVIP